MRRRIAANIAKLRELVMNVQRAVMLLIVTAGASAGCSAFGQNQQTTAPDPNVFPANYRSTLVAFLCRTLTDRSDLRGAMISEPALKPVGSSQRYVACAQFNPQSNIKTQAAIYLAGQMTQFVEAAPEQCADAAYQPFKELDAVGPSAPSRQDILNDPRGTN